VPPSYDLLYFAPDAKSALDELRSGQAGRTRSLLAKTRGVWAERGLWTELVRRTPIKALEKWCRSDPKNPDAWLLSGFARIPWAWQARSAARAGEVAKWQWELFSERLELAQSDLVRAIDLYPEDPTPWAGLIWIERGGGSGAEPIFELFAEGIPRDPSNYLIHKNTIMALTAHWHGNHQMMLRQAREAAALAAPSNDLAGLIAFGHYYVHFYRRLFDNSNSSARQYARDPTVQQEVARAFDQVLAARRGPLPLSSVSSWNFFGCWFWLAKDGPRLRKCFDLLKKRYTQDPWEYFGSTLPAVRSAEHMYSKNL
jgi:hypothetical protein